MSEKISDMERLAIAQALYKRMGAYVSTKDADSLRTACDREFLGMYESTGVDRTQVRVNGVKVGTYSVRETKPRETRRIVVDDAGAFMDWCRSNACLVPDMDAVERVLADTGEVPDGAHVQVDTVAGSVGTTLRIDDVKVVEALGGRLPDSVRLMLEGE